MVAGLVAYGIWAANGVSWVVGGTLPALQQELARSVGVWGCHLPPGSRQRHAHSGGGVAASGCRCALPLSVPASLPASYSIHRRAALSCAMGLSALRPDAPAGLATPEARAISQYVVAASVLSFAVLASQLPKQPKAKAA